jgi:ribosomal protein S18 acetylase RimI-like enzyme
VIRRLGPDDAAAFFALRRRALEDLPLAFASSPDDDLAADVAAARELLGRGPEAAVFGAVEDERLIGIVGLFRDRHLKMAHKCHLWGLYVDPSARRRGLAFGLVAAAIDHARSLGGVSWIHLTVSSTAEAAHRLYESLGFRVWGVEPDALRSAGRSVVDHHMVLRLD